MAQTHLLRDGSLGWSGAPNPDITQMAAKDPVVSPKYMRAWSVAIVHEYNIPVATVSPPFIAVNTLAEESFHGATYRPLKSS